MGLYLLNISVDPADPNPQHIPEDLSFNDQESIIEIIIEKVLGFEDAVKEYDDNDTEDHNKKNNFKIDLVVQFASGNNNNSSFTELRKKGRPPYLDQLTNGFHQLDTPPPKV